MWKTILGWSLLWCALYAAAEPHIKIGAILPLTGQLASFGEIVRQGIEAAQIKSAQVIYDDDACLPEKAVAAYQHLVSVEHAKLFLGPCCTSAVAALAPLIKKNGHIAMNFCTGSEAVHELAGGRIFHSQYSAQAEAAFNAEAMWKLGVRKPIVLYQESEFGRAHEKAYRKAFPGSIAATLTYSGPDRGQLKSLVLKMRTLDFDGVYVPLVETFLLGFMTEMQRAGIKGKRAFGVYAVQLPAVLEAEGPNAEGILYSYPDIPPGVDAAVYFAKLAAQMLEHAAAKCGEDTECVRKDLLAEYDFDSHHFLTNRLLLKTIKNGAFVELP